MTIVSILAIPRTANNTTPTDPACERYEDPNASLERVLDETKLDQQITTEQPIATPPFSSLCNDEQKKTYAELQHYATQAITWAKSHPHGIAYLGLIGEQSHLPKRLAPNQRGLTACSIETLLPQYMTERTKVSSPATINLYPSRIQRWLGAPIQVVSTDFIIAAAFLDFIHYEAQNFLAHAALRQARSVAAKYVSILPHLTNMHPPITDHAGILSKVLTQENYTVGSTLKINQHEDLQTLKQYTPLLVPLLKYNLE